MAYPLILKNKRKHMISTLKMQRN